MTPDINRSLLARHAQDLRDTWQCRCLAETKGKLAAVTLSVLMHGYSQAMPVLLRVAFPGFRDIVMPFISSSATIVKSGKVVADITSSRLLPPKPTVLFDSEAELIKDFRDLADRLALPDKDRLDLMAAVKRWVVADLRVDHMGRVA